MVSIKKVHASMVQGLVDVPYIFMQESHID
jgi:hypothetical protein